MFLFVYGLQIIKTVKTVKFIYWGSSRLPISLFWFCNFLLRKLHKTVCYVCKGRDTRCDKSLRHVAATGCCNKSPRVTCENHCRCDGILSLRPVAQIQTGLNSCDISQRQTKRKQLVTAAVQTRRLIAVICRIVFLGLNRIVLHYSNVTRTSKCREN